jgi:hypothetical protein
MHDALNPKFVYFSPVRSNIVDPGVVAEQVDHAIIALDGRAPLGGECVLEQIGTAAGPATLRIDLWVNDLSDYTCTYGFLVSSEDGRAPLARGERSVVSLDPASQQRSKWSHDFVTVHQELLKDLPAYA